MAFTPYYAPYQQPTYYQPPMPDQLAQLRQGQYQPMQTQTVPQGQQNSPIIWVQGESAARSYMVAAGNTVMLMDSDANTFYLKSADGSGVPQPLRIFDYTERTAAPKTATVVPQTPGVEYVTRNEFNALSARLDALTEKDRPAKKQKEDAENG